MSNNTSSFPFNPREHLMNIKSRAGSSEYLPVQWRLVWFRQECPQGTIETELVHLDLDKETEEETYVWNQEKRRSEKVIKTAKGIAIFRAIVKDGKGGIATGTKMEKAASFPDYLEKAETGSIGRALAALGYGTQFAPELNEEHRIVDSPVERVVPAGESGFNGGGNGHSASAGTIGSRLRAVTPVANANGEAEGESTAATEQQLTSIRKLCERLGKPEPENPDALSFNGARELIGQLTQEYRNRKAS
ncbi:MAG TPA: hypothetical protein VKV40_05430 [Ktedonobacteraceae bacterium]|nr:hypothetical protein [Ktedonobacteraceae bacterium]